VPASEAKKQTPTAEASSDIVSFYSMESKTIYLADGWTGKTPAELSILVHEMVHHLQMSGSSNLNARRHEKSLHIGRRIAWLHLFGRDLSGISSWTGFQFWSRRGVFTRLDFRQPLMELL